MTDRIIDVVRTVIGALAMPPKMIWREERSHRNVIPDAKLAVVDPGADRYCHSPGVNGQSFQLLASGAGGGVGFGAGLTTGAGAGSGACGGATHPARGERER